MPIAFQRAVFVSIHFNSSAGGAGVESYALAPEGVPSNASSEHHVRRADSGGHAGNALDGQNIALTASIHAAVLSRVSAFDRGVRHARFHVLRRHQDPGGPARGQVLSAIQRKDNGSRPSYYRQRLGVGDCPGHSEL